MTILAHRLGPVALQTEISLSEGLRCIDCGAVFRKVTYAGGDEVGEMLEMIHAGRPENHIRADYFG